MRKYFILALIVACAAYGAVTSTMLRGDATGGTANLQIDVDSADATADSIDYDTFFSDTVDILGATKLHIGFNMGTWVPCGICNDSVIITITPLVQGINGKSSRALAAQTFGTGIANYRNGDDSTRYVSYTTALDTTSAAKLWFRTVIKDATPRTAAQWFTADSVSAADSLTSFIRGLTFDVVVTK